MLCLSVCLSQCAAGNISKLLDAMDEMVQLPVFVTRLVRIFLSIAFGKLLCVAMMVMRTLLVLGSPPIPLSPSPSRAFDINADVALGAAKAVVYG
jgi:hypothetical protein